MEILKSDNDTALSCHPPECVQSEQWRWNRTVISGLGRVQNLKNISVKIRLGMVRV